MKRNGNYFLRNIGETYFLTSTDNEKSLVFLNETSVFLWDKLSVCVTETELIEAILKEYDISYETAESDVKKFVKFMLENNCVQLDE